MEAYALMRAIDKWGPKFRERAIFIRSDSMVALGMAKKLSSPHPSLNYLASELVLSSGSLKCSASLTTTCTENGMNRQTGSAESAIVATPRPEGLAGVHLVRAPVWDSDRFWLPPPNNIFEHISVR